MFLTAFVSDLQESGMKMKILLTSSIRLSHTCQLHRSRVSIRLTWILMNKRTPGYMFVNALQAQRETRSLLLVLSWNCDSQCRRSPTRSPQNACRGPLMVISKTISRLWHIPMPNGLHKQNILGFYFFLFYYFSCSTRNHHFGRTVARKSSIGAYVCAGCQDILKICI